MSSRLGAGNACVRKESISPSLLIVGSVCSWGCLEGSDRLLEGYSEGFSLSEDSLSGALGQVPSLSKGPLMSTTRLKEISQWLLCRTRRNSWASQFWP